ncbi:TetR/AcrR family transcriptional regulator, partial [Bacillus subtilis]|nr:TetR/AcrR family transcriptional regulator [Bacillus subtilis]
TVTTAGTAPGTDYLYFSSKNALIPAMAENLLTHTLDQIKGRLHGDEDFWTDLDILIDETFLITELHKDNIVICYSWLAID